MTKIIKNTECTPWAKVSWTKAHRIINKLQRRIFVATQQGRLRTVGVYNTYYSLHNRIDFSLCARSARLMLDVTLQV
jgi:uncharacterized protein YecE (DUF72 family)